MGQLVAGAGDDGGLVATPALVDVVGDDRLQLGVAGQPTLDEVHAAVVAGGHVDQARLAVDALADQHALLAAGDVADTRRRRRTFHLDTTTRIDLHRTAEAAATP